MWDQRVVPDDSAMTTRGPRQVTLWIESGTPPVGRVGLTTRPSAAFIGWLDLLGKLSVLFDGGQDEDPDSNRTGDI